MSERRETIVTIKRCWDYNWGELMDALWGEGRRNASRLDRLGKGEEFMRLLEDYSASEPDGMMELATVNDLMWQDIDSLREMLGVSDEDWEEALEDA